MFNKKYVYFQNISFVTWRKHVYTSTIIRNIVSTFWFDFNRIKRENFVYFTVIKLSFAISCNHVISRYSLKWGPRTRDSGLETPGPRTHNRGPTRDPGTQDPGLGTQDSKTWEPKNFKINHWKVKNHLQVNVITPSTPLHIFSSLRLLDFFSGVKVCFLHFQKDSGYPWFLFKWFIYNHSQTILD